MKMSGMCYIHFHNPPQNERLSQVSFIREEKNIKASRALYLLRMFFPVLQIASPKKKEFSSAGDILGCIHSSPSFTPIRGKKLPFENCCSDAPSLQTLSLDEQQNVPKKLPRKEAHAASLKQEKTPRILNSTALSLGKKNTHEE